MKKYTNHNNFLFKKNIKCCNWIKKYYKFTDNMCKIVNSSINTKRKNKNLENKWKSYINSATEEKKYVSKAFGNNH